MASGNPRPEIEWLKDDRLLTEQEVGEGRQKKWTLSLRNLGPEQSGRYTCKVTNRAGEINATYKVEVIRECRFPRTTNQVEKGSKVKCHVLDGRVRNFFYVRLKKKKPLDFMQLHTKQLHMIDMVKKVQSKAFRTKKQHF